MTEAPPSHPQASSRNRKYTRTVHTLTAAKTQAPSTGLQQPSRKQHIRNSYDPIGPTPSLLKSLGYGWLTTRLTLLAILLSLFSSLLTTHSPVYILLLVRWSFYTCLASFDGNRPSTATPSAPGEQPAHAPQLTNAGPVGHQTGIVEPSLHNSLWSSSQLQQHMTYPRAIPVSQQLQTAKTIHSLPSRASRPAHLSIISQPVQACQLCKKTDPDFIHCLFSRELNHRVHELAFSTMFSHKNVTEKALSHTETLGHKGTHNTDSARSAENIVINRPYLSEAGRLARQLLVNYMHDAQMHSTVDGAGNVIGTLECTDFVMSEQDPLKPEATVSKSYTRSVAHAGKYNESEVCRFCSQMRNVSVSHPRKVLILGSHHDTVANGGKWDGAYGVLAAIAVAKAVALKQGGGVCTLPFDIHIVSFDDEEGNNPYGTTNLGAKAYTGQLKTFVDIVGNKDHMEAFLDAYAKQFAKSSEESVWEAYKSASLPVPANRILGYVELHIEQGPVLADLREPLGVVEAIAGQTRMSLQFQGAAGHAGTVPMRLRKDALVAAAQCITTVHEVGLKYQVNGLVATIGVVEVGPGSSNVIPGEVRMTLDVRAPLDDVRHSAISDIRRLCTDLSRPHGVMVQFDISHSVNSVGMSSWLRRVAAKSVSDVRRASNITANLATTDAVLCQEGNFSDCVSAEDTTWSQVMQPHMRMMSGAGHDAQYMARVCSTAMIFVRCRGGISHSPLEHVDEDDAEAGALALMGVVRNLAEMIDKGTS